MIIPACFLELSSDRLCFHLCVVCDTDPLPHYSTSIHIQLHSTSVLPLFFSRLSCLLRFSNENGRSFESYPILSYPILSFYSLPSPCISRSSPYVWLFSRYFRSSSLCKQASSTHCSDVHLLLYSPLLLFSSLLFILSPFSPSFLPSTLSSLPLSTFSTSYTPFLHSLPVSLLSVSLLSIFLIS